MDSRYVSMRKVLVYAIQHNDQVLYSEYLTKSKVVLMFTRADNRVQEERSVNISQNSG